MDKDEIIRQLKRENESLKTCIKELVANWLCMITHILHQAGSVTASAKRIRITAVGRSRGRRKGIRV